MIFSLSRWERAGVRVLGQLVCNPSLSQGRGNKESGGRKLLAIKLMRTGAKKRPSYRIVVKEKQSKRDGACLENLGTYNPTRQPAEIKLKAERVKYWLERGAQPTDTVNRLIKQAAKAQAAAESEVVPA